MGDHPHTCPLVDGHDVPKFGLAAFRNDDEGVVREVVHSFLDLTANQPVKHVEISELYSNGHVIMDVLNQRGLQRSEIYLTFKIWPKNRNGRDIITSCTECLTLIQESYPETYFDLVLIHAPIDVMNKSEQWTAVETLKDNQVAKSIGVCGYNEDLMVDLMKNCASQPVIVEAEFTPFRQEHSYIEYCVDSSICVLVNNVRNKGLKYNNKKMLELAETLGISVLELHVQYVLSKGFAIMLSPQEVGELINFSTSFSLPINPIDKKVLDSLEELEEGVKTSVFFNQPKQDE